MVKSITIKQLYIDNILNEDEYELLKLNNNVKITNINIYNNLKDKLGSIYDKMVPEILCKGIYAFQENILNNNLLMLTDDQKEGIINILRFFYSNNKTFALCGYAGTGKTTTLTEFVYCLLKYNLISSLALTAPTNKATDIIRIKFKKHIDLLCESICNNDLSYDDKLAALKKYKKIDIQIITIHKLLNYNNDFNIEGDKIFVKRGKSNIGKYDLIIIDECSMLPAQIIHDIYDEARKNKNTSKIIFTGDDCQLPPIGEQKSLLFINSKKVMYEKLIPNLKENGQPILVITDKDMTDKIELLYNDIINTNCFTLTKIVRSNKDNIINLSNNIRKWVLGEINNPLIKNFKGNGVYLYRKSKNNVNNAWFKKFIEYSKNNSENIILTWRNCQCDYYNNMYRKIIFKDSCNEKYVKGDILIINEFYNYEDKSSFNNKTYKFNTSEQVKVTDLDIIDYTVPTAILSKDLNIKDNVINKKVIDTIKKINENTIKDYKIYKLYVMKLSDNIISDTSIINVLTDESINKVNYDRDVSANEIKKLRKFFQEKYSYKLKTLDKQIIKYLWKERDRLFISPFCNVNYGASISCHKSQASTYSNVFVDADDILLNKNYDECKRCIYTAITRTSNEVHILI